MSWREQMQAASFRGVPFEVASDSQPAGQRTQVHEYPQRDKPSVEPLGLRTKEIKLSAFVAGVNCLDMRDKLLEAIEQPGAGELIHPWLGSLTVSCTDCSYSHDRTAMGVVRFDLTFVEGEALPSYPVAQVDASSALTAAADDIEVSAVDRFTTALGEIDLSQVNIDAVLAPIGQVLGTLNEIYGSVTGAMDTALGVVDSVLAGPVAFASGLFGTIRGAWTGFSGFYSRVQGAMSLFGLSDRIDGLLRLGDLSLPAGGANRQFTSAVQALVQDAVSADIIRSVAVLPAKLPIGAPRAGSVAVGGLSASKILFGSDTSAEVVGEMLLAPAAQPPVADDVLEVRDTMSDALRRVAETSPADHYQTITQARALAARQLVAIARQGIVMTRYDNQALVPALLLAHRRYGDAARASEIIARNALQHPGFVPARELLIPKG